MILLSQKEQERDPLHLFIPEGNSRINQLQNWKSNQSKEWVSSTSKSWKITQLFIWTLNLKKAVWMNQPNEYYSHKTNKRHEINRINNCWNENKNLFSFKKKKIKNHLKFTPQEWQKISRDVETFSGQLKIWQHDQTADSRQVMTFETFSVPPHTLVKSLWSL